MLIPGGNTIGIRAYSEGLLVTFVEEGSAAQKAGLKAGDVLCRLDGKPVEDAAQLARDLSPGGTKKLEITRKSDSKTLTVRPEKTEEGYKLGAGVRDNVAGIGTVSYYDPETGEFGALGHAISDLTGASVLSITGGEAVHSRVREVVKGVSGTAGRLKGEFDPTRCVGSIEKNTDKGIFGKAPPPDGVTFPVAEPSEIKEGSAVIWSNVSGEDVKSYDIEILKCYRGENQNGRNLLIRVTDEELLQTTGGIVQGMSGSPIIQDGKLVGAVTHVLVNTPELGYGIFMETMLDAAA